MRRRIRVICLDRRSIRLWRVIRVMRKTLRFEWPHKGDVNYILLTMVCSSIFARCLCRAISFGCVIWAEWLVREIASMQTLTLMNNAWWTYYVAIRKTAGAGYYKFCTKFGFLYTKSKKFPGNLLKMNLCSFQFFFITYRKFDFRCLYSEVHLVDFSPRVESTRRHVLSNSRAESAYVRPAIQASLSRIFEREVMKNCIRHTERSNDFERVRYLPLLRSGS